MPSAPCPRGCWSARSGSTSEDYRQGARAPSACSSYRSGLGFLSFEEAQEGRMLGEVILDLGDARPGPVLEPGLGEVVLDAMERSEERRVGKGWVFGAVVGD